MTNYDTLITLLREEGMDYKWAKMFVKKLSDDEKAFPVDEKTKEWALSRGFYPGRVELYGLTEANYQQYLPDYPYFMVHPLNHHFKIWVNDKLTLKYVLNSNGCADTMPEYYLYVENNGNYTYLFDALDEIPKDKNFILNLLKEKGTLAIKPNSGTSGGLGFMKAELRGGRLFVNNKEISEDDFSDIVSRMKNHIVTEYAHQHPDLARIWPDSECTLRIIMAKLPQVEFSDHAEWYNIVSYARFGSSISGGASNLSSGGIGIGFDFQTGNLKKNGIRYRRFCSDGEWKCNQHPDTHAVWEKMTLPNWEFVKNKILHICNHIASLDYLGFDVIITPEGMKLCEINTHPAADYEQIMCAPILGDEKAKAFFENKGLKRIDCQRFLELYKKSQSI